ncbi:DNA binding protein [Propionibacterium phage PFR2]|uniref:Uncharacterized protein n=3 Tax=root TaxID=1 RepID=A0A173G9Q0_9CAUD|nr:DNA binding protein [Propionibacterium phage PFR1]YP_009290947.1 DNA binding protein [Propionibacterium phage PFR2]CEI46722.1 Protein of unknown function [Propionibacterium freudenreichii]ANH49904.1 hypothetical protein PFR_38 [Propionibacterium phage PFR1]ANH49963.1 hypothetical protein PFR2_38 [Propionibacterium phage PFR2]SCQ46806.1 Hypothetical protein PFR_JS7-1_1856 [Propionibacterium freudenreichii]SCQ56372.1 Hypothetical protein PFR_JS7-PH_23 [Propionibacterium freudenreichii]
MPETKAVRARRAHVIAVAEQMRGHSMAEISEALGFRSPPAALRRKLVKWGRSDLVPDREMLSLTDRAAARRALLVEEVEHLAGWRSADDIAQALGYASVKSLTTTLAHIGRNDLAERLTLGAVEDSTGRFVISGGTW